MSNDPKYSCVLSIFAQPNGPSSGAVLIAPKIALASLHCFRNHNPQMTVRSAITKKTANVKKIHFHNGETYEYGSKAIYPTIPVFTVCNDEIVVLELDDPLDGPFARPTILGAGFNGTLEVARENPAEQPSVLTAVLKASKSLCGGAVLEATPIDADEPVSIDSGGPAFAVGLEESLSVCAIQSGGDDGFVKGQKPVAVHRDKIATLVKIDSILMTKFQGLNEKAPIQETVTEGIAAPRTTTSSPPTPGLPAPMSADPPGFSLANGITAHSRYVYIQIPDVAIFDGLSWPEFFGWGNDKIFENDDIVVIKSVSTTEVHVVSTTASGTPKFAIRLTLHVDAAKRPLWLYGTTNFTSGGINKNYDIYLLRTHDEIAVTVPSRKCFSLEAYDQKGGHLGEAPPNWTVTTVPLSDNTASLDFVRLINEYVEFGFTTKIGQRQDDIGTGHEHK